MGSCFRSSITAPALFYLRASCPNAHAPYLHPCRHRRTAIPGSMRHMTTMDGGNADIAYCHGRQIVEQCRSNCRGANICPPIHGHTASPSLAPCGIDRHGWWKCRYCRSNCRGANICPPIHGQSFRSSITAPALFYLRASCPNAHAPYLHPCRHKKTPT
jgi:hypothetical protein